MEITRIFIDLWYDIFMKLNVIGDITGFGLTLEELHKQMPEGDLWLLGDIIDRGPNSQLALDYIINGDYKSVMGNHDHMMLFEKIRNDLNVHHRLYPPGCWGWNGGEQTAESFGLRGLYEFDPRDPRYAKYFEFIEKMPLRKELDNVVLTHAPISDKKDKHIFDLKQINQDTNLLDRSALWNRNSPSKILGKIQLYGHNSTKGVLCHTDKHPQGIYMNDQKEIPSDTWAMCIDTWREGYLTGLHIDTDLLSEPHKAITVIQQKIVDPGDWQPKKKVKSKGTYEW